MTKHRKSAIVSDLWWSYVVDWRQLRCRVRYGHIWRAVVLDEMSDEPRLFRQCERCGRVEKVRK